MSETYHHGNLRNELITAGLKMLNRDGAASFSLRKLSQKLGVSHTAAYRHFKSREELLKAILIESSLKFHSALEASINPDAEGYEALMQLGSGYVHFFLDNPEILPLFAMIPSEQSFMTAVIGGNTKDTPLCGLPDDQSVNCEIETLSKHSAFGIFRKAAASAIGNDLYCNLSEKEILLGFWSKVHGMATILVTQKNFIPAGEIDAVIERVIRTPFQSRPVYDIISKNLKKD